MGKDVRQMSTIQRRRLLLLRAVCKVTVALLSLLPGWFPASVHAQSPSQSVDEDNVRSLTKKFGETIAAGDLETMRGLWDPQSPELASRLSFYKGAFLRQRVELINVNVTRLEVTGNKATSNLTSDERYLDKKTGGILSERDAYHGVCRSFEWTKIGTEWKIEREFSVQDELAAKLDDSTSQRQGAKILVKEKEFVTDALVQSLGGRGHRYRVRGEYDAALPYYQLQQVVSEKIGDQAGIATALGNVCILKYAQDEPEEALLLQQKALALFEAAGLKRGVALALAK